MTADAAATTSSSTIDTREGELVVAERPKSSKRDCSDVDPVRRLLAEAELHGLDFIHEPEVEAIGE